MLVEATMLGYYGDRRRRVGEIFNIADPNSFSSKWMKKVDDVHEQAKEVSKPKSSPKSRHDEDVI